MRASENFPNGGIKSAHIISDTACGLLLLACGHALSLVEHQRLRFVDSMWPTAEMGDWRLGYHLRFNEGHSAGYLH